MMILGHKPSEIRKAIAAFSAALLVLVVALPIAGMPAGVVAVAGTITAVLVGVSTYLSKPNVAAIIDSADNIDLKL